MSSIFLRQSLRDPPAFAGLLDGFGLGPPDGVDAASRVPPSSERGGLAAPPGIVADPAAATAAIAELSSKLDVYEAILGKQKYLAGDINHCTRVSTWAGNATLTLADLFHLGYGTVLGYAKCDLMTTKGPNISR
ncbi:hypothetical protein C8J57DRAFT_1514089 [Mycena rebaudengoi]|nr:hypothetical protein C8J57DRAFT_1514089 [Mycena rebaudengoi]